MLFLLVRRAPPIDAASPISLSRALSLSDTSSLSFADLRNLAALDPRPLSLSAGTDAGAAILERATEGAQLLMSRLFALEAKPSDAGPLAVLPAGAGAGTGVGAAAWRLPRRQPPPEPKPMTRWEKFAAEKGIKKKQKREKLVWDETTQSWRPRYGYQRVGENDGDGGRDDAIVELKKGDDIHADPWATRRKERKERVDKNSRQQMRNRDEARGVPKGGKAAAAAAAARAAGAAAPAAPVGVPVDLEAARAHSGSGSTAPGGRSKRARASDDADGDAAAARADAKKRQRGAQGTAKALALSQRATASLGKFDESRPGEPDRKERGRRRHFSPNVVKGGGGGGDAQRQLRMLSQVLAAPQRKAEDKARKEKQHAGGVTRHGTHDGEAPGDVAHRKKGRSAGGKMTKITKARGKK